MLTTHEPEYDMILPPLPNPCSPRRTPRCPSPSLAHTYLNPQKPSHALGRSAPLFTVHLFLAFHLQYRISKTSPQMTTSRTTTIVANGCRDSDGNPSVLFGILMLVPNNAGHVSILYAIEMGAENDIQVMSCIGRIPMATVDNARIAWSDRPLDMPN